MFKVPYSSFNDFRSHLLARRQQADRDFVLPLFVLKPAIFERLAWLPLRPDQLMVLRDTPDFVAT
jgi:hypothetical protein